LCFKVNIGGFISCGSGWYYYMAGQEKDYIRPYGSHSEVLASYTLGYGVHAVVLQCLLFIILLLLLAPNLTSAALPTVEALPSITSHLHLPSGVAVGDDEKIYVAETNTDRVHVFSQSGKHQGTIAGLAAPSAVAVDAAGRIYIGNAGSGNVEVYDPDFSLVGKLGSGDGEFRHPIGIAVSSAGLIYVVDRLENKVKIFNTDHSFKSSFGSTGTSNGQFQFPTSITINETISEILIPDITVTNGSARVQVFDLNGVFHRSFATAGTNELGETVGFIRPFGITVDNLDRIYVTDGYQNVVTLYDIQGNYLGNLYDSNHPLRNPLGIVFAPGTSRLFVASLNTRSVKTYGIDSVYGRIAASPQSHDFGSVTVNDTSTNQRFDLSNEGSGDIAIGAITLTGANASDFFIVSNNCANQTLIAATGCAIEAQLKPGTAGSKSALLSIVSSDIYMPALDIALSGNAGPPQHRLTVIKDGAGSGLVQAAGLSCGATCSKDYTDGALVTLSALPSENSTFVGWLGGGCTGSANCMVTMEQAITVSATFDVTPLYPVTYSIAASAGSNGSISPTGTITAGAGSTVTFDITANADYHISDVLVDGVSVGAVDSYSFEGIGVNHAIAAEFSATETFLRSSIEIGEVSVGHEWKRVNLSKGFVDPVIVVKPASRNDTSSAVTRVRNVDAQGFELRIQEWSYLDNEAHAEEQVGYIVMERGSYTLQDGSKVEAGRFDTDATFSFEGVNFTQTFAVAPVVMSSLVTYNEDTPVIGRMSNIDATGFGYMLQEEKINYPAHAVETVSFIAWEPSQGSQDGISFEVGAINDALTQQSKIIEFSGSYLNQPLLIADIQTTNGGAVNLRWNDKSVTGATVLLDEEESANAFLVSVGQEPIPLPSSTEKLGYLVLWSADLRPYKLTVEKSGLGSGQVQAQGIDCGVDCNEDYSEATSVTLSAVAADGSVFAGWSGNGCSGTESCVVTMNQAITVTALFDAVVIPTYTLTVAKEGLGSGQVQAQGIDCGVDCSEDYSEATSVTLSAVAADGSVFAGWSGSGCNGTESCVVTMNQTATVAALFDAVVIPTYTLTVAKEGLGSGQVQAQGIDCGVDCSEDYSEGTSVTLSAVAADGSVFAGWSGNGCSGTESCVVTMNQAATVTALFDAVVIPTYTLTVVKEGLGSGQVQAQGIDCGTDCSEDYSEGASVVLSAVVAEGSLFVGWGGDCVGSGSCVVTMDQNHSISMTVEIDPDIDTDNDGIPDVIDTDDDNDGMPDAFENQRAYLDSLNQNDATQDQDADGLTNLQEYQFGSDPAKKDTDRDGLSDKYEMDNGLDPRDGICPSWVCGGKGGWRHALQLLR